HRDDVERDDPCLFSELFAEHLRPAAGRGAQIDDAHPCAEKMILVGELDQLERCARPIAKSRRLLDPVVIDVLVYPRLHELVLLGTKARHGRSACDGDASLPDRTNPPNAMPAPAAQSRRRRRRRVVRSGDGASVYRYSSSVYSLGSE